VPLFALGFGLPYTLLSAPLDYYTGFVLSHKYGQSPQVGSWLFDQFKGLVLMGVFGPILLEIIYLLPGAAPQTWWLWMVGVMLIFTVLLSNLALAVIFLLFFTYKPLEAEDLVAG
jgi:hypothetical protein